MSVDLEDVLRHTREIITDGNAKGILHEMTPRLVRERVETAMSLDAGELSGAPYKNAVKEAIQSIIAELKEEPKEEPRAADDDTVEPAKSSKKRKSLNKTEGDAKKPKLDAPPKPKAKRSSSSSKQFKSSEIIATSDVEPDLDAEDPPSKPVSSNSKLNKGVGDSKSAVKETKVLRTLSMIPTNEDASMQSATTSSPPRSKTATAVSKAEPQSESEMSVLFDEPPKPKRAAKSSTSKTKVSRAKAASGSKLTKDEETIKKLKSFVVACGVRKVWSKVFADIERPSQQISKLKEILAELGMTGRLSIEKAKAIREKRELAQELGIDSPSVTPEFFIADVASPEDVKDFDKAVNSVSKSRGGAKKKVAASSDTEERAASDSESEEEVTVKRKSNARASIMAFLADQSDEE
ncbi:hypothetical protein ONZ45_g6189 [Pleurotus djamor]|nr:hypothetical protein ONZ45_g6189 [Pleurotus djamor]